MKKYLYNTIPRFQSKPMTYTEEPSHYVKISNSIKPAPKEKDDGVIVPSGELFKLHHTEPNKIFGMRRQQKSTLKLTTEKEDGIRPSFGHTPIAYYSEGFDKFKDMKDFVKHSYDNNEDVIDEREGFTHIQTRPVGERSILRRLLDERKTDEGKLIQLKYERERRQEDDFHPHNDPEKLADKDDIELEKLVKGKKEKKKGDKEEFNQIIKEFDKSEVERVRKIRLTELVHKKDQKDKQFGFNKVKDKYNKYMNTPKKYDDIVKRKSYEENKRIEEIPDKVKDIRKKYIAKRFVKNYQENKRRVESSSSGGGGVAESKRGEEDIEGEEDEEDTPPTPPMELKQVNSILKMLQSALETGVTHIHHLSEEDKQMLGKKYYQSKTVKKVIDEMEAVQKALGGGKKARVSSGGGADESKSDDDEQVALAKRTSISTGNSAAARSSIGRRSSGINRK